MDTTGRVLLLSVLLSPAVVRGVPVVVSVTLGIYGLQTTTSATPMTLRSVVPSLLPVTVLLVTIL